MPHIQHKASPVSPMSPASPNPKVNRANPKVNRAKNQYRASGILCALAHGKLYFEALKMFSVPQNDLPRKRGRLLLRSRAAVCKILKNFAGEKKKTGSYFQAQHTKKAPKKLRFRRCVLV